MIIFDISQKEVNKIRAEQGQNLLENLEKLKSNSDVLRQRGKRTTILFTPLSVLVMQQISFVLDLDQKELAKELGNSTLVKDTLKDMAGIFEDSDEETSILVDTDLFNEFVDYITSRVNHLINTLNDEETVNKQ